GLVAGDAVALLDPPDQLVALPLGLLQVVIGELAPLLPGAPHELLPVALELIPIHACPPPKLAASCRRDNGDGARLVPFPKRRNGADWSGAKDIKRRREGRPATRPARRRWRACRTTAAPLARSGGRGVPARRTAGAARGGCRPRRPGRDRGGPG